MYSSRAIEKASYESIAVRYIAANEHPDHYTLCAFRRRFPGEIEKLFVQVLQIAKQMKLLRMGTIALEGTKIHANASRHNALSYEVAARKAKAKARGKRPGGRPPTPPTGGARETDQINLADEESRIMPRSGGGGFDQCYNAQAAVDTESMLIVGARLTNSPVDVRQLVPMLNELSTWPETLGRPSQVLSTAWRIDCVRKKAERFTDCANRRTNRCSASSSR